MDDLKAIVGAWEEFFKLRVRRDTDIAEGYVRYVERLLRADFPPIFEINHLASLIGVDAGKLAAYIADSASFYRSFEIPKRRGGYRVIDVPSPGLLFAQRWIVKNILSKIGLHDAVHGFALSRSVVSNAKVHLGQPALLKMDLMGFFPSIGIRRGLAVFRRIGYPPNVSYFLAALCFKNRYLPQGAATSPVLSNIIAKRLDARLAGVAMKEGLNYSRYADDLTFSGQHIDPSIIGMISKVVGDEGFNVNQNKTQLIGPGSKKIVTGVSISSGKLALPRKSVRAIKQEAHFLLKFGYFSHVNATDNRDPILVERLLGRIGFWLHIDPSNPTALNYFMLVDEYRKRIDSGLILPSD